MKQSLRIEDLCVMPKVLAWGTGVLVTMILGLMGVVYSSVDKRIDAKADNSVVLQMQKEVHDMWLEHVRAGMKTGEKK
jgi:hypothetical protein